MSVRRASILVSLAGLALASGLGFAQNKDAVQPASVQPAQLQPALPPTFKPLPTVPGGGGVGGVPVQPAPAAVPTGPAPKVDFNELTHEFGTISDEKEVETKFKFTNSGVAELEIMNLLGSCGCTVPQLEKKKYAPGESGEITVKYNPHNRRGKQHTQVTVTTNDPAKNQVILGLSSEVKPTIMTDPQVAALGQVERGKEGKVTIKLTSRKLDFMPTQVTPNDTKVEAKIGEKKEIEIEGDKALEWPIEITLSPNAEVGQIQTQCTIRTNDPGKTLNFMVLGEVVGQIKAEPQRVTLGGLAPNQDISTTFRIAPRAERPFKVLSVTEEPAPVPVPNNPQGSPGAKMFEVSFTEDSSVPIHAWVVKLTGKAPGEGGGTFRGDMVIKTDMPGEETVKVPYYGFIRAKPKPIQSQNPAGQPSPSLLVPLE